MFLEGLSRVANRIEGATALTLVGSDGIPIETVKTESDVDLEELCAEMLSHVREMTANHQEFDVGQVRQLSISTANHRVTLSRLVGSFFLLLVTRPDASLGRARFELRRAQLLFEAELS